MNIFEVLHSPQKMVSIIAAAVRDIEHLPVDTTFIGTVPDAKPDAVAKRPQPLKPLLRSFCKPPDKIPVGAEGIDYLKSLSEETHIAELQYCFFAILYKSEVLQGIIRVGENGNIMRNWLDGENVKGLRVADFFTRFRDALFGTTVDGVQTAALMPLEFTSHELMLLHKAQAHAMA